MRTPAARPLTKNAFAASRILVATMDSTNALDCSEPVVSFLSRSSSYPEHPHSVQIVETHISWVFLTDRYAYKLKKPVRFEFLDFSTSELRRRACLDELRLNRRLAPHVYLAVLPVTDEGSGRLTLGGRGPTVDWVVHMRRLPADKALDVLLTKDSLPVPQAEVIARRLVDFYQRLPALRIAADDYCRTLSRHIHGNADTLTLADPRFRRVIGAQLRYLAIQAKQFGSRAAAGRVVEGHGDLRPEHIFAEDPPAVIDCIEFSDELRRVDIADELAFLAMECRRLGDGGFGELVLSKYQDASGDAIPERLLAFYCSYRACVRAKVTILKEQQRPNAKPQGHPITNRYFDIADDNAGKLGAPSLVIVGGLSGTGKSTLAAALTDSWGADLLSTDQIRRSMHEPSPAAVGYGEGIYRTEARARVYEALLRRAEEALKDGRSVVLDGTFPTRQLRQRAYGAGTNHHIASLFVHCTCPRDAAQMRIEKRLQLGNSMSEARADIYDVQTKEFEAPDPTEMSVAIDSTRSISDQLHLIYDASRRLLFE